MRNWRELFRELKPDPTLVHMARDPKPVKMAPVNRDIFKHVRERKARRKR